MAKVDQNNPSLESIRKIIENKNKYYPHCSNILCKSKKDLSEGKYNKLIEILPIYAEYLEKQLLILGHDDDKIDKRVLLLNNYYNEVNRIFPDDTVFNAQDKFKPTILEEFMYFLFKDYVDDLISKYIADDNQCKKLVDCGCNVEAYTNLYFTVNGLEDFFKNPQFKINTKAQDFVVFRKFRLMTQSDKLDISDLEYLSNLTKIKDLPLDVKIGIKKCIKELSGKNSNLYKTLQSKEIFIPILAIENKTYLDKTMLSGIMSTAEKLKDGNPYTRFIVVTGTYEVNKDLDPKTSKIDQIYVLKDSQNGEIRSSVIKTLMKDVKAHLERQWVDIETKIKEYGTVM